MPTRYNDPLAGIRVGNYGGGYSGGYAVPSQIMAPAIAGGFESIGEAVKEIARAKYEARMKQGDRDLSWQMLQAQLGSYGEDRAAREREMLARLGLDKERLAKEAENWLRQDTTNRYIADKTLAGQEAVARAPVEAAKIAGTNAVTLEDTRAGHEQDRELRERGYLLADRAFAFGHEADVERKGDIRKGMEDAQTGATQEFARLQGLAEKTPTPLERTQAALDLYRKQLASKEGLSSLMGEADRNFFNAPLSHVNPWAKWAPSHESLEKGVSSRFDRFDNELKNMQVPEADRLALIAQLFGEGRASMMDPAFVDEHAAGISGLGAPASEWLGGAFDKAEAAFKSRYPGYNSGARVDLGNRILEEKLNADPRLAGALERIKGLRDQKSEDAAQRVNQMIWMIDPGYAESRGLPKPPGLNMSAVPNPPAGDPNSGFLEALKFGDQLPQSRVPSTQPSAWSGAPRDAAVMQALMGNLRMRGVA